MCVLTTIGVISRKYLVLRVCVRKKEKRTEKGRKGRRKKGRFIYMCINKTKIRMEKGKVEESREGLHVYK